MEQVHTAFPGIVQDFNGVTATIKPSVIAKFSNEEVEYPEISQVPIMFPIGIVHPVKKGDFVLVICSEVSLDNWINAKKGSVVPADDERRFALTDAFALPNLQSNSLEQNEYSETEMILYYEKARVALSTDGKVNINNGHLVIS